MKNIFGSELLFWVSWLVLCFFFSIAFCLGFCSIVWFFAPENGPEKFFFMSGLLFFGVCSLSLSFSLLFRRRRLFVFVVFKRESSGLTGHTPHRTVLFFFLFVPAALGFSTVLAVRPFFLAFCRGAILGPGFFFGFSWNLRGLSSLALSEALFGREAARVFGFFSLVFLCCFPACGIHTLAGRAGS